MVSIPPLLGDRPAAVAATGAANAVFGKRKPPIAAYRCRLVSVSTRAF